MEGSEGASEFRPMSSDCLKHSIIEVFRGLLVISAWAAAPAIVGSADEIQSLGHDLCIRLQKRGVVFFNFCC